MHGPCYHDCPALRGVNCEFSVFVRGYYSVLPTRGGTHSVLYSSSLLGSIQRNSAFFPAPLMDAPLPPVSLAKTPQQYSAGAFFATTDHRAIELAGSLEKDWRGPHAK
jgi:hypothetical protein